MPDRSLGLFEEENISLGLFDDDVGMGLFVEDEPSIKEKRFKVPRTEDILPQGPLAAKHYGEYPSFKDPSVKVPGERVWDESMHKEITKDIEPLPEADVEPSGLKSALALQAGALAFVPSGWAGLAMGMIEPSKDQELDIPGLLDVGGDIKWDLKRAAEYVEHIGGDIPKAIIGEDERAVENIELIMGPIEVASKAYGDYVYENWPDRDEAEEMGAIAATIPEAALWIGVPWLVKAKLKIPKLVKEKRFAEAQKILREAQELRVEELVTERKTTLRREAELREIEAKRGMPLLKPEEIRAQATRPPEIKTTLQKKPPLPYGLEEGIPAKEKPLSTGVSPEEFLAAKKPTMEGPSLRPYEKLPPIEVKFEGPEVGMPLLKPKELAPGSFRGVKEVITDINTTLGERGSLFGERTPIQQAAYDRLKGDVDKIRFEANKVGKTIEKYLLDRAYDPRVAYSVHKYAGEMLKELKPVEVKVKPQPEELKSAEALVKEFSTSPRPGTAAEKLKNTKKDIYQYARSPEDVYTTKGGKTGKNIYQTLDHANQEFNAWAWKHIGEFTKKIKGIKKGSIEAEFIGKALDGQIKPEQLTRRQRKIYDYLKERFDFLINFYARQKVGGNEVKFAKIANAARKYTEFTDRLKEIKGDRKLVNLPTKELKDYKKFQQKRHKYMKDLKLEELSPGEREALDLLSRKIHDYLPHLFDKDRLLAYLKADKLFYEDKLKLETKKKRITRYKNSLKSTNETISKLQGGAMITYKQLPREVHNKFFKPRKGKEGYSYDAIAAYEAYIYQMGRKLFYDPAIRTVHGLHKQLPSEMRDYNTWYVRNFLGIDRPAFQDLAGIIVAFQWMRTMGLNPRSAIVNLTQRMNTVAEVGAIYSARGEKFAFTKEGKELFDSTGIAREIPNIIFEGPVPAELQQSKAIVGYLFNKIELGNRRHAFLSAYLKAKEGKVSTREARRYGIKDPKKMSKKEITRYASDVVHRTQFRYGKVGMPRVLQTSPGRVAGQFTSFTIKQLELINHWRKTDPLKLVKWVGMAEGGNFLLQRFMDTDLSNALGFGVNWAEALEMLKAIPDGDFRKMYRQWRLTFGGGSGVLPTGPGPTVTGAYKTFKAMSRGYGWKQLKKELTPVQYKRIRQAWLGLQKKQGDLFPIYNTDNHLMYYVTARELLQRTFGPAPAKEGKQYEKWLKDRLFEQEYSSVIRDMVQAIAGGKSEKFDSLVEKYGIVPTDEQILNEIYRRELTLEEREALESFDKRKIYQMRQEGE